MMKNLFLVLLAAVSIIFTSCAVEDSADVNQDKIYADYELFYNENTDKTRVVASFRFGGPTGTILELTGNASVTFDGEKLPFKVLYSGHSTEFAGKIDGGTFVYTNVENTVFTNTTPSYESVGFPDGIDKISKSSAFELAWEGTSLKADQRVGVFIGSWKWGQDALFIEDGDGATSIIMGTNQLKNVATGSTTFYMDRTTAIDVVDGTEKGGRIRSTYRAKNIDVTVEE